MLSSELKVGAQLGQSSAKLTTDYKKGVEDKEKRSQEKNWKEIQLSP